MKSLLFSDFVLGVGVCKEEKLFYSQSIRFYVNIIESSHRIISLLDFRIRTIVSNTIKLLNPVDGLVHTSYMQHIFLLKCFSLECAVE